MSRLSKREKEKIERGTVKVRRGSTWIGIRPSVMKSTKHDVKRQRRENRKICNEE